MAPTTAPLLVACVLLALGGAPKTVRPAPALGALRSVGLRVPPATVRVFGAGEAALGIACAIAGTRPLAGLVALSYLGFTGFLIVALRAGGAVSSCGCVGREDTPPTRTHVAVTAILAGAAAAAVIDRSDGIAGINWSGTTAVALVFAVMVAWLCWLALTALPRLATLRPSTREA
jgi:hypothetical protein